MLQLGWDRWKGIPRPGAPRNDRHCRALLLFSPRWEGSSTRAEPGLVWLPCVSPELPSP